MAISSLTIQANNYTSDEGGSGGFPDVPSNHYAYDYINMMVDYGIINGYSDGTFGPNDPVSRGEFAKMMVLTLQLNLNNPGQPTFEDVQHSDWEYKYVETSKYYMTMWHNSMGYFFKPDVKAVREDLAVAIVKGLGLGIQEADLSVLEGFTDADDISSNMRPYIAVAVSEGIMIGNGAGQFNPQSNITRAETATLLARLIEEEKVTFDEEKVTFDEFDNGDAPVLSAEEKDNYIQLQWTPGGKDDVSGYKVVVSQEDSTPVYPDQGYLTYTNDMSFRLEAGQQWNNGETDEVIAGQTYYVSITVLYDDGTKAVSNVEVVTIPDNDVSYDEDVVLQYNISNGKLYLDWTDVELPISYYKVVMSKYDSSPMYPGDGYMAVLNDNEYIVEVGDSNSSAGDFSYVESGESYYVAITVVYSNGTKVSSNVLSIVMPEAVSHVYETPTLSASTRSNDVLLSWTGVTGSINYYKIVLSKSDSTPSYPDNGYLAYQSETSYEVEAGQGYNGGDVGTVRSGQTYYAAITVVYTDGTKRTSNVKTITIP